MSKYVHIPTVNEYKTGSYFADLYFILNMKPKETFQGSNVDINQLTYSEVKSVIRYLDRISKLNILKSIDLGKDVIETCFKVDSLAFNSALITDYISTMKYLELFFIDIQKKESALLSSFNADTVKWLNAGGDKLDVHSDVLPLVQLGKIYGQYPYELQQRKYVEILKLLKIEIDLRNVDIKMSKAS